MLERLEVSEIVASRDEPLDERTFFPIATKLIYKYDYGDNWMITITKEPDCGGLLENGFVSDEEIVNANEIVLNEHQPVCIHKEGVLLLDDVGGLSGFADFLGTIYESEDKEKRNEDRAWAKSLGWSEKKIAPKMIL